MIKLASGSTDTTIGMHNALNTAIYSGRRKAFNGNNRKHNIVSGLQEVVIEFDIKVIGMRLD